MGQRQSAAVYRRRRLVALLIIALPLALLLRACTSSSTPTHAPSVKAKHRATTAVTETTTAHATTAAAETATVLPTPQVTPKPTIGDCSNAAIEVAVTTDASTYLLGMPVTITMRIANVGGIACRREIGALSNEIYVTDVDGALAWSSDACQTGAKPQIALMQAGALFGNTQKWDGRSSGRVCESAVADAVPGDYLAYARNDTVVSKPVPFSITLD